MLPEEESGGAHADRPPEADPHLQQVRVRLHLRSRTPGTHEELPQGNAAATRGRELTESAI